MNVTRCGDDKQAVHNAARFRERRQLCITSFYKIQFDLASNVRVGDIETQFPFNFPLNCQHDLSRSWEHDSG